MVIPSQAIALVWTLRSQGRSESEILEMLRKPLTQAPYALPVHDWFARWRKAHAPTAPLPSEIVGAMIQRGRR